MYLYMYVYVSIILYMYILGCLCSTFKVYITNCRYLDILLSWYFSVLWSDEFLDGPWSSFTDDDKVKYSFRCHDFIAYQSLWHSFRMIQVETPFNELAANIVLRILAGLSMLVCWTCPLDSSKTMLPQVRLLPGRVETYSLVLKIIMPGVFCSGRCPLWLASVSELPTSIVMPLDNDLIIHKSLPEYRPHLAN